jgi:hypothetical protein
MPTTESIIEAPIRPLLFFYSALSDRFSFRFFDFEELVFLALVGTVAVIRGGLAGSYSCLALLVLSISVGCSMTGLA